MAAKLFEVGDILPATTQLRISWNSINDLGDIGMNEAYWEVYDWDTDDYIPSNLMCREDGTGAMYEYIDWVAITMNDPDGYRFLPPYDTQKYCIINTTLWSLDARTVTYVDANLTWEDLNPAPSGYSITYEENGGTSVTDLTEQTALPSPLPTPTKDGHVFAGWYYDNLFTQKANAGDELTANVTLYAKWYTPTTWCEDIADAIREKEGSSGNIKHVDFPDRIRGLDTCIYLTQEEYDLLDPPNENITYIIVEVE